MIRYTDIEHRATQAVQRPWLCMVIIAVATVAAYLPTFGNQLQEGWDDAWQVTNQYTSGGFTWQNLRAIFIEPYYGQYSPLNQCMYILLYNVGRYQPALYHGACLLLHIINACLVCVLLRKLFAFDCFAKVHHTETVAFAGALFFALNPLQVEAVAWVSASKVVLHAMFYLAATLAYMKTMPTSNTISKNSQNFPEMDLATNGKRLEATPFSRLKDGKRWWLWYMLALFLFLCSYGSKEQAVIFPVWLVLLHWVRGDSLRQWGVWLRVLPFFALAGVLGAWFMFGFSSTGQDWSQVSAVFTIPERIEIACFTLAVYVRRWLLPFDLSYYYHIPDDIPAYFMAYPVCVALLVVAVLWKAPKAVRFGMLFFVLHLALTLHIVPMDRLFIMADRYMYLPCIGLACTLLYGVCAWTAEHAHRRRYVAVATCALLVVWGVCSHVRCARWYDSGRIKTETALLLKSADSEISHFIINN